MNYIQNKLKERITYLVVNKLEVTFKIVQMKVIQKNHINLINVFRIYYIIIDDDFFKDLPQLTCKSFCILDSDSGEYLAGIKTGEIREIASLTKTMTCLVVFRLIKRFNLNPLELYFSVTLGASETIGTSANLS